MPVSIIGFVMAIIDAIFVSQSWQLTIKLKIYINWMKEGSKALVQRTHDLSAQIKTLELEFAEEHFNEWCDHKGKCIKALRCY